MVPSAAVIVGLQASFQFWVALYLHPGVVFLDPMVLLCWFFFCVCVCVCVCVFFLRNVILFA